MKRILVLLLAAALFIPAVFSGAMADGEGETAVKDIVFPEGQTPDTLNRVFYEIFPGSFSDSDGDGTGDLRGIINRMDYLNDGDPSSGRSLGVGGIWLTPVFSSPSYHKYDVTDYYTIDPAFGTTDDLKELIALCHERDVKLILDLPINHTSIRHAWFKSFSQQRLMKNAGGAYYDWYACRTEEERLGGHTYSRLRGTDLYYECNFSADMPELNFDSEAVRSAVLDIAKYYLEMGVDGFRFDAAKYIYYNDHKASAEFWKWYADEIRAVRKDAYLVAEVWDSDGITDIYAPYMNCFDFTVSQAGGLIASTAQGGDVNRYTAYVEKYLNRVRAMNERTTYVPFIANHDTDRCAGYLPALNGRAQMAANLYLLGPGSPFIYYGEEIGLKGSRGGANTDANRRLAMRWGDGDTVKDPPGASYDAKHQTKGTVESLKGDPNGIYTYYKRVLMIRAAHPEIALGDYRALSLKNTKAGGFVSTWEGSSVMVLHNMTPDPVTLDLSETEDGAFTTVSAWAGLGGVSLEGTVLTLGGQTSAVLR